MSKSRSYVFTINNDTFEDLDHLMDIDCKYFCIGFEEGEEGTPHIQGYVQFENPISFKSAKNRVGTRCHIEVAKGNFQQNIDYCSKDGSFYEFGERPHVGGSLTYDQIVDVMKDPKSNPHLYNLYRNAYSAIQQHEISQRDTETKFYKITPVHSLIQEVFEYFNFESYDGVAVVTNLSELAAYTDPRIVIYDHDDLKEDSYERNLQYYPQGMPIHIKKGYEYLKIKPEIFVLRTNNPKGYPFYNKI